MISQGGIRSGADAWTRIKGGADLVQIYTPLMVEGPKIVGLMLSQMQDEMRKEGVTQIN